MSKAQSPSLLLSEKQIAHYRILDAMLGVLDAHDGAGRAARRVTLLPQGTPLPIALRALPPAAWSAFGEAPDALRPRPGWFVPDRSAAAVTVVALFGLDAQGIRIALDHLARQQRETPGFLPVCFTDWPDHAGFRRRGYVVEYFVPENCQGAAGLARFRERFQLLWRKWGVGTLVDLSRPGLLADRIGGLDVLAPKMLRVEADRAWERPKPERLPAMKPDIAALSAEYAARGLEDVPDTFVLYRIIGNDLHPRHEQGQSLRNVRFILDNEPTFAKCEKRWVVNRIVDPETEASILDLLDQAGQTYLHIRFDRDDYARQDWDFSGFSDPAFWLAPMDCSERMRMRFEARLRRHKVNYVINNNGARNAALNDGRNRAKWVLPWDGNCFLSQLAWDRLVADVTSRPYLKYFQVPMARLSDTSQATTADLGPLATEEPQVIFRFDAEESFDEAYPYGRRPKVSLFWKLGIPGDWDLAGDDVWDVPRPERTTRGAEFGSAGWVARLPSGRSHLEAPLKSSQTGRELARNEAIVATLDDLDRDVLARHWDPDRLAAYDETAFARLVVTPTGSLAAKWRDALLEAGEAALQRGLQTVVEKTTLPPSGDPHDYWHPAPFWWPNPATADGLPLIRRDGERIPGTELYSQHCERYDRTRLQRLFDDATVCALTWRVTGERRFAEHATAMLRCWFIDPRTRMNPHLTYAQWRPEPNAKYAGGYGLIEMKDLYFFLDAVRLLRKSEALDTATEDQFRTWLAAYLDWICAGSQGAAERAARNNHGTCFDLQVGAIAAYLGDLRTLSATLRASKARILTQFSPDGSQEEELKRNRSAHYTSFNLQSWVNLVRLAKTVGCDLWRYEGAESQSLRAGMHWLVPRLTAQTWTCPQVAPFDWIRRMPLAAAARDELDMAFPERSDGGALDPSAWPPVFHPHDGVRPFWLVDHLSGCVSSAPAEQPDAILRASR
ncbi:alginate lyase family protein [Aquibium sp. ELW1220]|uniref:alginate lyase family protein n=1 Tax=Aquibium sp. ELW1220 TaxID=2976766 RepID=UPI0025B0F42F|nr:alginate lyase family protein [Aquibium sp. ELW1220]MDN2584327.1 alginate lyase family protein [Aquibium sp. ELW1220]